MWDVVDIRMCLSCGLGGKENSRVKGGSKATETGERYISSGHP